MADSQVLVLKVHNEDITEEEALAILDRIASQFGLRVTIHGHVQDDPRFWDEPADKEELSQFVGLARLVDSDLGATVGYLIDDGENVERTLAILNGLPDPDEDEALMSEEEVDDDIFHGEVGNIVREDLSRFQEDDR